MSFRDSFFQVKGLFEERLHDMGLVDADADSMGWTSMLSIEQDTQLSISVPSELSYGSASQITGILETEHFRRLTGKIVTLEVDGTEVTTTYTNENGEYTFNYSPSSIGNLTFQVIFDSDSDNYNDCSSSTVNAEVVVVVDSIVISSDKSVLSYVDSDKATLYAQLKDSNDQDVARSGISITFNRCESDGSVIETLGTADTDATGKATLTDAYSSQGLGDIYFCATDGILLSETYDIQDIYKYGTSVSSWSVLDSSVRKSDFVLPTNHEIIFKFNNTPQSQIAVINSANNYWQYAFTIGFNSAKNVSYRTGASNWNTDNLSFDLNKDYEYRITLKDATLKLYVNNELIATKTVYTGNTETKYIRFIGSDEVEWFKIKQLQSIDISVDNPILSFADSTQANPQTATLTATINPIQSDKTVKIYQDDVLVATETTDNQGQVSYEYESQGVGDVEFEFTCGAISETTTIEDCYLLVATCNRTGFVYNSSPFPVSAPVEISGLIKKDGSWGGTRIYGSSVNYVFLSNNSSNSNEGEKIRYNLSSTEVAFKVVLDDTSCQLYINDVLINSVNVDTSGGTNIWGGSGSNPVTLTNLKVKAL